MNLQPNYQYRNATLKDILFFYEAMTSLEEIFIEHLEFDTKFKLKLEDAKSHLLVIEDIEINQVIGCVVLQERQNLSDINIWIEIQELFIFPKYRKLKAAEYLYYFIEKYVQEKSIHKIKVACKINSTLNQNFYTKKGFKIEKKSYGKFI